MSLTTLTVLTAASFTAGVIEGASVIRKQGNIKSEDSHNTESGSHLGNGIDTHRVGNIKLAATSTIYGILSLPLSIVGASPSLNLLERPGLLSVTTTTLNSTQLQLNVQSTEQEKESQLPKQKQQLESRQRKLKYPGIVPNKSNDSEDHIQQKQKVNSRQRVMKYPIMPDSKKIDDATIESNEGSQAQTSCDSHNTAQHEIGGISKIRQISDRDQMMTTKRTNTRSLHWYVATLDGRPLSTPLAEMMKRTRFLLAGVGIFYSALLLSSSSSSSSSSNSFSLTDNGWRRKTVLFGYDIESVGRSFMANKILPDHISLWISKFFPKEKDDGRDGVPLRLISGESFSKTKLSCENNTQEFGLTKFLSDYKTSPESSTQLNPSRIFPITRKNSLNEVGRKDINYNIFENEPWYLGDLEEGWYDLPISRDWLVTIKSNQIIDNINDNNTQTSIINRSKDLMVKNEKLPTEKTARRKTLLLESNVTLPFRRSLEWYCACRAKPSMSNFSTSQKRVLYECRQEQRHNFNVARLQARKVQRAACKKQIFKGNDDTLSVEANSDSIMFKKSKKIENHGHVLQIFIKSGDTVAEQDINIYSPLSGHYLSQGTVLIDALTSISFAIDFLAETILSEHDDIVSLNEPNGMFQAMQTKEKNLGSDDPSTPCKKDVTLQLSSSYYHMWKVIDFVGRSIRKVFVARLKFSKLHTRTNDKNIHLFSDDNNARQWVQDTMGEKGWNIIWHDIAQDRCLKKGIKKLGEKDICLCLCEHDETTINLVTDLFDKTCSNIICVVENPSLVNTIEALTPESDAHKRIKPLCISSVYDTLFNYSRELLYSGKSPKETEVIFRKCLK